MFAMLFLFPSSIASADTGMLIGEKSSPPMGKGPDVQTFQDFAAAARRFEKHLFVGQDGLLYVNAQTGAEIGISETWYQVFETAMEETNRQLRGGALDVTDVRLVDGTHNVFGRQVVSRFRTNNHVECVGRSGLEYTWMGPRLYLNDCQTHLLVKGLYSGATLGLLCVQLGITSIPCGALSAVAAVGASTIDLIDEMGEHHGVYIQYTWNYQLGWIWHQ